MCPINNFLNTVIMRIMGIFALKWNNENSTFLHETYDLSFA